MTVHEESWSVAISIKLSPIKFCTMVLVLGSCDHSTLAHNITNHMLLLISIIVLLDRVTAANSLVTIHHLTTYSLQNLTFLIFLHFCLHNYAISTNIEKAFLHINLYKLIKEGKRLHLFSGFRISLIPKVSLICCVPVWVGTFQSGEFILYTLCHFIPY